MNISINRNLSGQIPLLENIISDYIGAEHTVAVNSGSAALHLAVRLAAEKKYGRRSDFRGMLADRKVFCADLSDAAAANAVVYEGGEPVFVDISEDSWGMDPEALTKAFEIYPEVKIVIASHLYGFPCKIDEIKSICESHDALLIEDCRDAFGSKLNGRMIGSFGDYSVLSFGKGRIADASGGGALITKDKYSAEKARYWANGAHSKAPWNLHEDIGFNYSMSELIAVAALEEIDRIDEYISERKAQYERLEETLSADIFTMNPIIEGAEPNYARICAIIESCIDFKEVRSEHDYIYEHVDATVSPMEKIEELRRQGIDAKPVYRPLSMQPIFRNCEQISLDGAKSSYQDFYREDFLTRADESRYVWERGMEIGM